jgi:GTP-binding protein
MNNDAVTKGKQQGCDTTVTKRKQQSCNTAVIQRKQRSCDEGSPSINQLIFAKTTFLKSAAALKDFPPDVGKEVAFIGRSNAGKSTAINVITGIKKLAKTSKTPGRTQLINFFTIDPAHCLVDLPGYGYAKVPDAVKQRWQHTIIDYLEKRKCLQGLFLIMDIRHPLKSIDEEIIEFAHQNRLAVHILLTKADKLSNQKAQHCLRTVTQQLNLYSDLITVQIFSSTQKIGITLAQKKIAEWFESATLKS